MDWLKENKKLVITILVVVGILLVVIAVWVGVTEAIAAAGVLGAGAGAAWRVTQRKKVQESADQVRGDIADSVQHINETPDRVKLAQGETRDAIRTASDAEKVKMGEDLLGGD